MKPDCLCGHPAYLHSIYHQGRCIGIERTSIDVVGIPVDYPCTCIEYQEDDGTDGDLALHKKPLTPQKLPTTPTARKVQPHKYWDVETGEEHTCWDVMAPSPARSPTNPDQKWGEYYLIARYSDKAAAEEHARTGRRPPGYG